MSVIKRQIGFVILSDEFTHDMYRFISILHFGHNKLSGKTEIFFE